MMRSLLVHIVAALLLPVGAAAHARDVEYTVVRSVPVGASPENVRRVALESALQQAADETPRIFLKESTLQDGRLSERSRLVGLSLFSVVSQVSTLFVDVDGHEKLRLVAVVRFDDAVIKRRFEAVQSDFELGTKLDALAAENSALRSLLEGGASGVVMAPGSDSQVVSQGQAVRDALATTFAPGSLQAQAIDEGRQWDAFCASARSRVLSLLARSARSVSVAGVHKAKAGRVSVLVDVAWSSVDPGVPRELAKLTGARFQRKDGALVAIPPDPGAGVEFSRRFNFFAESRVYLHVQIGSSVRAFPILVGLDEFLNPTFDFDRDKTYTSSSGPVAFAIADRLDDQRLGIPPWVPRSPTEVSIDDVEARLVDRVKAFIVIYTPDGIVTAREI